MLRISRTKYNRYLMLQGINSKELAEKSGLNAATISRALTGKSNTSPDTIGKIAKALNCKPADILEEVTE